MAGLAFPVLTALCAFLLYYHIVEPLVVNPLSRIPGPKFFAWTKWRLAYEDWKGTRTRFIQKLHVKYGPVVRIGPNEVSFNSLSAMRTIYGPGAPYGRTDFYQSFSFYGKRNMFSFKATKEHGERKKLFAAGYAKSVMLKAPVTNMIEAKVEQFMDLISQETKSGSAMELFSTLHYYSLDNITEFLYGEEYATKAMEGRMEDRTLIADVLDPARRRLAWFSAHFYHFTIWLYSRAGAMERALKPFLPMQKPSTYTGIRKFAYDAYFGYKKNSDGRVKQKLSDDHFSLLDRLWEHHEDFKGDRGLGDLDVASEVADHLLAGIDTTSDTLMFLIWALSLPQNLKFQGKLAEELRSQLGDSFNEQGVPRAEVADKLPYLDAIIKETLRLYAPLPATEPRWAPTDTTIDGFTIPAHTVIGMDPYSLHRNPDVFPEPTKFDPERWLGSDEEVKERKKWFWAFSSGGKMCIGMHLAMAEMTCLAAAIYSKYRTRVPDELEHVAPGVTSRFEVFSDDTFPVMEEHKCLVKFKDFE
ncbi:putative P450 monooxygenase [Lophiotrema nucula]|uniref:Putative P450 monooxygenase n=1 Tax=Lophiotrema nucula TaxID=690887 RepID=A0A6A5YGS5_9PLEO|nr:putative P450 monooxygenase [Lophiotrema nucula]